MNAIYPNRRVMFLPITAGTYYPTGVVMGISNDVSAPLTPTASRSTSAAASIFVREGAGPKFTQQFSLVSIDVIKAATAGAGNTCDVQMHGTGDSLIPQLDDTATTGFLIAPGRRLELNAPFHGGFKVVLVGASNAILAFTYDIGELR